MVWHSTLRRFLPAVVLAFALTAHDATAQTAAVQADPAKPDPANAMLGVACNRVTDKKAGVIKRDACGRWYCGRTDVKDVIEVRPDIAKEMGCEWKIDGNNCVCRRAASVPKPQ
jgi:hypothetical protein